MLVKCLQFVNRKRVRRGIGILLAAVMLFSPGTAVSITGTGGGSLKAEGTRCRMVIQGSMKAEGIAIEAQGNQDGISVSENFSLIDSTVTSQIISADSLHVERSEITAFLDIETQGQSLIRTDYAEISGSRLKLTGEKLH